MKGLTKAQQETHNTLSNMLDRDSSKHCTSYYILTKITTTCITTSTTAVPVT